MIDEMNQLMVPVPKMVESGPPVGESELDRCKGLPEPRMDEVHTTDREESFMQTAFGMLPGFEDLRLSGLSPASPAVLQHVASDDDEELFRATAKMVVELQDIYGAYPSWVADELGSEHPSLVARHGRPAIERIAEFILASEIPALSSSYQELFDGFNQQYFSGTLDRYQVQVVFDPHILPTRHSTAVLSAAD
jgi:hypothetical protein